MMFDATVRLPATWSAVDRRFLVHLYEGHLSLADMDVLDKEGERWSRDNPEPRVELAIIYPSAARMSPEERARMGQLIKRWEHRRIAGATVILAEGLMGAMHRSILTGLQFIAPPKHPQKVFGAIAPALLWLMPHIQTVCGPGVTHAEVSSALDEMCRAFHARAR